MEIERSEVNTMLKKSIHIDLIYQELSFEERFAAAKRDGFDAVELYWKWEGRNLAKIKELLEENKLQLSAISGDLPENEMISMCDPAQKETYLESVRRSLEASEILGNRIIMLHAAAISAQPPFSALPLSEEFSDNRKFCAMYDVMKTIAPWAEKKGITFVLEPLSEIAHSGYLLKDTKTCGDLVRAVNSPNVKILYDAYHAYLEEGKLCETISQYIDDIGLVHIADAPGRHEPGTGAVNWKNVLKHLVSLSYDGYVSFEFYPESTSQKAVQAVVDLLASV